MKLKPLITAAFLITFLWGCTDSNAKRTSNHNHVKQLLVTKRCQGCDLGGADLSNANLAGADLREAELSNANLNGANLRGADLSKAEFIWSDEDGGGEMGLSEIGDFSCNVTYKASLKKPTLRKQS